MLLQFVEDKDAVQVLRSVGARVGRKVRVSRGVVLHNFEGVAAKLTIGDNCHIGREVLIDLAADLTIGERVTISMRCMLLTHTDTGDSRCGIPRRLNAVVVQDDAYIGAGAIILPGVTIGSGAVIGAGAVVTRNVAPGSVVAGTPARLIGAV
jgi:acetyltransferase-like isoleucine patch superfamily enzyme